MRISGNLDASWHEIYYTEKLTEKMVIPTELLSLLKIILLSKVDNAAVP